MAAPLRVPAARLRRVPDVLGLLQGRAARHPRPAHRADGRGDRRAPVPPRRGAAARSRGWRVEHGRRRRRSPTGAPRPRSTPSSATSDAGRAWLDALEKVKDPWFNMGTGDGLYHYYRSWLDDPSDPVRVDRRAHRRARSRGATSSARPRSSRASATASPTGYAELLAGRAARARSSELLAPVAHGVPVRRGAQVLLRLLVPDVAGTTRSASSARCSPSTASSRTPRTSSSSRATRSCRRSRSWRCTGRPAASPLGPTHWPPIVARRRELLAKLADWTPPPALGTMPEAVERPDHGDALGHHARAPAGVGAGPGRRAASSCAGRRRRPAWSKGRPAS